MKNYKIRINKKAKKFIDKQPTEIGDRIYLAIYKLPYEGDIKPLSGQKDSYRLRVGKYRIIYHYVKDEIVIEVTKAENRGDIYKWN